MTIRDWGYIAQESEDALHIASRLLAIEVRPYTRLSNHLTKAEHAFATVRQTHLPSPPPDAAAADEEAAAKFITREQQVEKAQAWRSEVLTNLELMDYTALRSELTIQSNNAERERYTKDKVINGDKQQDVTRSIKKLQAELEEAKKTLAIRKEYDELAEKITSSKMLKPRDEQKLAHAKLDEEIAELKQQVQNAKDTWEERRQQFQRIDSETQKMANMIKEEKMEAERKEGMMKDGDDENDGDTTRGDGSYIGTPRPDGSMTPIPGSQATDSQNTLKVPQERLAPLSRGASTAPSPARSGPAEDAEMADSGENPTEAHDDDGDSSGLEEGEDVEDGEHEGEQSGRADQSDGEMDER
ncbi:hypothetical protein P280DRAFT_427924 [Massarina eburnea CBS 473.64]|uniref:Tho complex subunit 7 n=1 Tax=Massarina eburnea CBS 473.64 TaxID=1395130 RepID=A0A6A6RX58_9PLEO|nr:hypothetical protein P280DRAFT_427924 [Massarina eburnea CBS 473.64]